MTGENDHDHDRDAEERLIAARPLPRTGYRADLRAHLLGSLRSGEAPPRRLRLLIAAYAGAGAALLIVAAIGVAGGGPLAP